MRMTTFNDAVGDHLRRVQAMRRVHFTFDAPAGAITLTRPLDRFPYVPSEARERDERCYEAYNIQVHGLMKRLQSARIERVVIGVSGGLDSTHALIVCARTMDRLELPRTNILAYTMPGFATSRATAENARALMAALGVTAGELERLIRSWRRWSREDEAERERRRHLSRTFSVFPDDEGMMNLGLGDIDGGLLVVGRKDTAKSIRIAPRKAGHSRRRIENLKWEVIQQVIKETLVIACEWSNEVDSINGPEVALRIMDGPDGPLSPD
jgi:hypothetical protein